MVLTMRSAIREVIKAPLTLLYVEASPLLGLSNVLYFN